MMVWEEAAGFMGPESRAEGQAGDRKWEASAGQDILSPATSYLAEAPLPRGRQMLAPLGLWPTCPLSFTDKQVWPVPWAGELSLDLGPKQNSDNTPPPAPHQPTQGCPPTPAKCRSRNAVAAGPESQDRNTQDTYVRLGSTS